MSQSFRFFRSARLSGGRALAGIGMLAGVAVLGGCKLDTSTTPQGPQAIVQFINAAPRYSLVDLAIDGASAVAGQPYGTGSTFPVDAPGDSTRTFTVSANGDTTTLASGQFVPANLMIYTLVVTQRPVGAGLILLPDTVSAPPSGDISLRVVNASPTAGAVDLYITGADSTLATPTKANIQFEDIVPYVSVPIGPVRVRITTAGTKTVLLDINESPLAAGQAETILLVDSIGGVSPVTWLEIPDR